MRRLPVLQPAFGSTLGRQLLREPRRPAAIRDSRRAHWYVVGAVCIGAFMCQLDASIVTVALPRIGAGLDASLGAVEWVALSYLLVLVATVVSVGRIADAFGRKLIYVYGFGVFGAASALCGLAPTLPVLIAARVLQAGGAAMLQANSVALIAEAMPRHSLAKGLGVQGSAQALGLAMGPALGGILLSLAGWRLIFLVNVPVAVVGLALGWFLLPRSRSRRPLAGADRLGALLLALGGAGPLIFLSLAGREGYGDGILLACLLLGVLAAAAFVRRERHLAAPLIDISILRRRPLVVGLASGLISFLALFGVLFTVPYYLASQHLGPLRAGLELAVLPAALGATAPLAGRLVGRLGVRGLTGGGLVLAAAGMLEISRQHSTGGMVLGLALCGVGLGAFIPANNAAVMAASPDGHAGVVAGLLSMTRGMGTALGVAIAGALLAAAGGLADVGLAQATTATAGQGLTTVLTVLGLVTLTVGLALLLSPRRP